MRIVSCIVAQSHKVPAACDHFLGCVASFEKFATYANYEDCVESSVGFSFVFYNVKNNATIC